MKAYPRLQKVAAVLVGATLFASGSFKLIDPVGTGLIVEEYGKLFHLGFLTGRFAEVAGYLLSLLETVCGGALLTGVFRRTFRGIALGLIGLFTLVTVYLAVKNPAMDCGCFGEVLHLSHTASLVKNLVLLGLCFLSLTPHVEPPSSGRPRYVAGVVMALVVIAAAVRAVIGIPPSDFTEFTPGVELAAAQPDDAPDGEDYSAAFIYEKDGRTASFSLDAVEKAENEGWSFIRTETLRRAAAAPQDEVVTLSFLNREDLPCDSLAAGGKVMIVSVYDTPRMKPADWQRSLELLRRAGEAGMQPLLLVEAPLSELDATALAGLSDGDYLRQCSYQADRRKLLALNRDNGGATYFSDGMLVMKWAAGGAPSGEQWEALLSTDPVEAMMVSSAEGRMTVHGYFLVALAVALLL